MLLDNNINIIYYNQIIYNYFFLLYTWYVNELDQNWYHIIQFCHKTV